MFFMCKWNSHFIVSKVMIYIYLQVERVSKYHQVYVTPYVRAWHTTTLKHWANNNCEVESVVQQPQLQTVCNCSVEFRMQSSQLQNLTSPL